jgi:signal transduction histidine kinase
MLWRVRSDVQDSAIAVRDLLLDSEDAAGGRRKDLRQLREQTMRDLDALDPALLPGQHTRLERLRHRLYDYWQSLDSIVERQSKPGRAGIGVLRQELLLRRQAALELMGEVESLTAAETDKRKEEIDRSQAALPYYVARVIGVTILIGVAIGLISFFRILALEKITHLQHRKVAEAEVELRDLSGQLVRAQEIERKSLSRELHDHVGQLLTAIRIGIGNVEEALGNCPERVREQIEQTKRVAEQALGSVRDLAMGLRPSMLDDLGLGDALQWQARQHARICGVPVAVLLEGELDDLSDAHRTCVFRVVQEALNNVAKHARARDIRVEVANRMGIVSIMVRDDGEGFGAVRPGARGLGIVGIKERVRQLGGQVTIDSQKGQGTSLWVLLPLSVREVAS